MAHEVWFRSPSRQLGKADVKFDVWDNDSKLGTLTVSQGSVVWFGSKRGWGFKATWKELAKLLENNGSRWERR